jgi:hypothetical protein
MKHDSTYNEEQQMMFLMMGKKNEKHEDLVDLYAAGFYSEPNIDLRAHVTDTLRKFFYARVVGSLWYE